MAAIDKIDALMLRFFPKCPLCGEAKGYVVGWAKNTVECKSCRAKWFSEDFINGENLTMLKLKEPSTNGKGNALLYKDFNVKFWQDPETIDTTENGLKQSNSVEYSDKLIFQLGMSNQELEALMMKSLKEVTTWDYGSTINGVLGPLIGSSSYADATMIRLLRAIFEQNKILILQNELLRKTLQERGESNKTG